MRAATVVDVWRDKRFSVVVVRPTALRTGWLEALQSRDSISLMLSPQTCPLCANVAVVEWQDEEAHWLVTCPTCLRFTLDEYLIELFRTARLGGDRRVLLVLPRLSQAAQQVAGAGGRLNLMGENWHAVARDVESPR
jgi:hypothetical protein